MKQEFRLVVRLMAEPCLWRWEIHDRERGTLVESSWTSCWTAYERREDARAAGVRRLAELVCPGGRVGRHLAESEVDAAA